MTPIHGGSGAKCPLAGWECRKANYGAYSRKCKDGIAEQKRRHYHANKKRIAARAKALRQADRAKASAQDKRYCERHRGRIAAYMKEYRRKNRARLDACYREWKERRREAGGSVNPRQARAWPGLVPESAAGGGTATSGFRNAPGCVPGGA